MGEKSDVNALSPRPMRLLVVEFDELYATPSVPAFADRHQRRPLDRVWQRSGTRSTVCFTGWPGSIGCSAVPHCVYLAAVAPNVPLRVLLATTLFLGLILAAVLMLPQPLVWVYLIVIPVFYKVQSWSHASTRRQRT